VVVESGLEVPAGHTDIIHGGTAVLHICIVYYAGGEAIATKGTILLVSTATCFKMF